MKGPNKFRGTCTLCGATVEAGAGTYTRREGLRHLGCRAAKPTRRENLDDMIRKQQQDAEKWNGGAQ